MIDILAPIPAEPFEPAVYDTLAEILANDHDAPIYSRTSFDPVDGTPYPS